MSDIEPLIVAHRGFHRDAPENSIPSFEMAKEVGASMVELDVRRTSDGHPVVFHDHSLYRTTAQRGIIEMLTLKQVRKLDIGVHHDEEYRGTRVPTLEEVIKYAKNRIPLNIEIKTPGIEEKVVRLIRKHGVMKRVVVSSFRFSILRKIHRLEPEIRIGGVAFYISGFEELQEDMAPYSLHLWAPLLLSRIPVDAAHNAGIRVLAWPVNSLRLFKVLKRLGVDGVITSIPDRIADHLHGDEPRPRRLNLPPPLEAE